MAIKFLSNVDIQGSLTLNDNQLTNFVVENLNANPSAGNSFVGRLYYNNSDNTLRVCTNASTPVYTILDGSDGVNSFTNANGTFVSAGTENTSATGAVTMGTIDLSATGTPGNTTFLRGDNVWATPAGAYTSWSLEADSGSSVNITDGLRVDFTGGTGISTTVASATPNTLTIDLADTAVTPASYTYASITVDQQGRLTSAASGTAPGTMSSWTIQGDSGNSTVADGQTVDIAGGTYITSAESSRTVTLNHDSTTRSDTSSSDTVGSGGTFTKVDSITTNATGHLTAINLETITMGSFDNYGSWTIQGDSGSSSVSSGQTVDVAGGTNITTSESGRTLTVNLDNSITLSGDITIQGGDITTSGATTTFTIIDDEASALTFSSSGSANVLTLDTAATPGVGITGTLDVSGLSTLTGGFSAGAESAMGNNKITGLADGTAAADAVTLGQVQALVAGVGIFRGGYNANTGQTTDLGAGNGAINGASNIASDLGDFYAVTTAGTQIGVALETGDLIFANTTIAASSNPANSAFTVVQAGQSIASAASTDAGATKGIAGFDSGNFSVTGNGYVTLDDVALGTKTSGNYTQSVAASTVNNKLGIAVSGATGEGQAAVVGVDITGQTDIGSSVAASDEFLVYDAANTTNKKVTYSTIASNVHDSGKFSDTYPATSSATWTVNHGLGTTQVLVQSWLESSGQAVTIDFTRTDANNVAFTASSAQTADSIRVLVTK
jgi:hypothetical protein